MCWATFCRQESEASHEDDADDADDDDDERA